jgi:hypothetical protein
MDVAPMHRAHVAIADLSIFSVLARVDGENLSVPSFTLLAPLLSLVPLLSS